MEQISVQDNCLVVNHEGEPFKVPLHIVDELTRSVAKEIYFIAQGSLQGHAIAKTIRERYKLEIPKESNSDERP